jgi:hypothetical protein
MRDDPSKQEDRAIGDKAWSEHVASIALAACVHAKALTPEQLERCLEITAEETFVRLVIGDRPPPWRALFELAHFPRAGRRASVRRASLSHFRTHIY